MVIYKSVETEKHSSSFLFTFSLHRYLSILMSQPPLSILALGITPAIVHSVNNRLLAQGIDATSLVVTNTPSSDAEITRVASSKNWSGLMVGYGIRGDREWFKRIIQIIHHANPNIPLIDHQGPGDAENAIERHFNVRLPLKTT